MVNVFWACLQKNIFFCQIKNGKMSDVCFFLQQSGQLRLKYSLMNENIRFFELTGVVSIGLELLDVIFAWVNKFL